MGLSCFGKFISMNASLAAQHVLPENRPWHVSVTSVRRPFSELLLLLLLGVEHTASSALLLAMVKPLQSVPGLGCTLAHSAFLIPHLLE